MVKYTSVKSSPDGLLTIGLRCYQCEQEHSVTVPETGFSRWRAGALIQSAMPELSPMDREKLMTGMCEACQRAFFTAEMEV